MLMLTPQTRIFLSVDPADFRCGIDGLAQVCRQHLEHDPFSGAIFCFRNRAGTALKLLCFDGIGFWLCLRRFSKGKVQWWPKTAQAAQSIDYRELHTLLWNGDPRQSNWAEDWRRVA
jgi:transposase